MQVSTYRYKYPYVDDTICSLHSVRLHRKSARRGSLLTIQPGETWSYAQLARTVGRPHAVRAGGTANGANQFAIVIPCHRVITSSGELGGYGGGLPRKRWLIDHERRVTARAA